MPKSNNNVLSELANVYLKHDKLDRVTNNILSVSDEGKFKELLSVVNQYHSDSAKELHEIIETLPDVPVHNSYDETSPVGLPEREYSLTDIEDQNESYRQSAIYEAEVGLRKYYQDALMNIDAPDSYKKVFKEQLSQLSELLEKLEQHKREVTE